jgi:EAL domain-containing protein (putative c-di-GMP-specific phosphodiesterase class I)
MIMTCFSTFKHSMAAPAAGSTATDYLDRLTDADGRADLWVDACGLVVGRFLWCNVTSALQPVFEAETLRPVGVQALARLHGAQGTDLSPWNLFALAAEDDDLVLFDRRCRLVHALNFFARDDSALDLHLCVQDRLLSLVESDHGRAFRRVLEGLEIDRQRVVIVLPSLPRGSEGLQAQVVANYRSNGFRVALTPTDAEQLDALVGRIPPDIVRVDAGLLGVAPHRLHAGICNARDRGAAVLVKRIDSAQLRDAAIDLGATHLKGFLLAPPALAVTVGARAMAQAAATTAAPPPG